MENTKLRWLGHYSQLRAISQSTAILGGLACAQKLLRSFPQWRHLRAAIARICTKGETSIEGKANFFEGVKRLPQNAGWSSPNTRTMAGTLFATTTNPTTKDPFKTPTTASIDHVLKFKWNCCPNVAGRTELVARTP